MPDPNPESAAMGSVPQISISLPSSENQPRPLENRDHTQYLPINKDSKLSQFDQPGKRSNSSLTDIEYIFQAKHSTA